MNEALAGLVVATGAHEARRRGELVAGAHGVATARRALVAHAGPFLEPRVVVADLVGERAADPVDLVDLDAGPRRAGQADQKAHRPAIIGREVKEGWIVFFCHGGIVCVFNGGVWGGGGWGGFLRLPRFPPPPHRTTFFWRTPGAGQAPRSAVP